MLVRRSVLWAVVVSIVLTAAAAAANQIERSESPDREPAAATAVEHSSQHRRAADGILEPGESVTMKRPIGGWLREDHRGPGAGLRHYVGMIMFENDEAVGDLDVIEQTFRRRLDIARQAAAALDAIDSDPEKLRELSMYASVFAEVRDHEEALAQIRRSAAQHYRLMLDHVRPQDLEALTTEQRERGDR